MAHPSVGQAILELRARAPHSWRHWVHHAGVREACDRVALWLQEGGALWLASEGIAGKSLFLDLLADSDPRVALLRLDVHGGNGARFSESKRFWLIDVQPEAGTSEAMQAFFWLERARARRASVLIAARESTVKIAPPELASRVRAMPCAVMRPPPDDAELKAVLRAELARRQWEAPELLLDQLLKRAPRTLEAQLALLDALDRLAIAERVRRITNRWVLSALRRIG